VDNSKYKDIRYSTRNPVSAFLVKKFSKTLKAFLRQTGARRVLEIGCGEGFVTRLTGATLSPQLLIGSDYSQEWIGRAKNLNPAAHLMILDARRIPFRDNAFDLVLAIEVLEHVKGPETALEEIARVTSQWAILSVPRGILWRLGNLARGKYIARLGNTPGHINEWSARTFRLFVEQHFTISDFKAPFPWQIALLKKK